MCFCLYVRVIICVCTCGCLFVCMSVYVRVCVYMCVFVVQSQTASTGLFGSTSRKEIKREMKFLSRYRAFSFRWLTSEMKEWLLITSMFLSETWLLSGVWGTDKTCQHIPRGSNEAWPRQAGPVTNTPRMVSNCFWNSQGELGTVLPSMSWS